MYKIYVTNKNTFQELIRIYRKWDYSLITYTDKLAELEKENAKMIVIEITK